MFVASLAEWDWTSPELPVHEWWFFGVVLVVLMIIIWAVVLLTTSSSDDIDPAEIDRQMLTAVNELRSQGELTSDEYRSIKSRLVKRLSEHTTAADFDGSSHNDQQLKQSKGSSSQNVDTCDEMQNTSMSGTEDPPLSKNQNKDENLRH